MSVKRLSLLNDLHKSIIGRTKELWASLSPAHQKSFEDVRTHLDFSHKVTKELLARAKTYRERDKEKKK
jgi:hypothetical protein